MGLIKAGLGALGGTLADQWKEFFYCDSLPKNVLMVKGQKRTSDRSSNTKGNDNIISKGSGIAVADGQCMIIVEQGKIVEVCAEPGEFTYDSSTEPSIFAGSLGESIKETFKLIGKRFTYGGDTGKDQRVYYFNTKEILDNKFGTATPIPFRVVDRNINLDTDVSVRCSGIYSFQIADPLKFYTSLAGNVEKEYTVEDFGGQLKLEFVDALQPAFAALSALELRPSAIPGHKDELVAAMNESLVEKWGERGLKVKNIAMNPITLPEEDQQFIKEAQRKAMLKDPGMAGATLAEAQAAALTGAANNSAGAMTGFMGLGMAMNAGGGVNPQAYYQMAQQNQQTASPADGWTCPKCGKTANGKFCPECGTAKPEATPADAWVCPKCGKSATGKFCPECGTAKPAADGWTCTCGTVNKGKFCSNCGTKKPADALLYKCDKCGWEPEDPSNPPKFCPECGDPFDDKDVK